MLYFRIHGKQRRSRSETWWMVLAGGRLDIARSSFVENRQDATAYNIFG
jgi:hypothetical protein